MFVSKPLWITPEHLDHYVDLYTHSGRPREKSKRSLDGGYAQGRHLKVAGEGSEIGVE
jgi:hypothetical protein